MNVLSELVKNASVAYVHHIMDCPGTVDENSWYQVSLEVPDSFVQTVEFTVGTFEQLEEVLAANGWTHDHSRTMKFTQS